MMLIESKYNIGDTVYLKTDTEQRQRLVTGITVRITGTTYGLSSVAQESWHYDFEMSTTKNVLIE